MFDFILTNICSGYIISDIEHLFREHLFESHYTCIQFYFSVLSGRSGRIFTKKERITMNRRSSRTTQRRKMLKRAKRAKRLFTGFICALIICVSGSAFLVSAQGLSDHDTHRAYQIMTRIHIIKALRSVKATRCGISPNRQSRRTADRPLNTFRSLKT